MTNLILRYNLKDGVTKDAFEDWVRCTDYPKMRGLKRIQSFHTYRVTGLLVGEGKPAYDYYELFEIEDFKGFCGEDMPGQTVQSVMAEFLEKVENWEFNIAEPVE